MSLSTFWGFFCSLILAIWLVPSGLKWFAFEMYRASVPYGPLSMSWANEICTSDAEERTIVLGLMNSLGYAFNAWVPILTYPASDSPRFRKGFVFSTVAFVAQFGITGVVWWMHRRDQRRKGRAGDDIVVGVGEESVEVQGEDGGKGRVSAEEHGGVERRREGEIRLED